MASTLILILPRVQPLYEYHLFQNATFSASIVFWPRKRGEEDLLYKVRDDASPFIESPFEGFWGRMHTGFPWACAAAIVQR